jgi:hypothetical protein
MTLVTEKLLSLMKFSYSWYVVVVSCAPRDETFALPFIICSQKTF